MIMHSKLNHMNNSAIKNMKYVSENSYYTVTPFMIMQIQYSCIGTCKTYYINTTGFYLSILNLPFYDHVNKAQLHDSLHFMIQFLSYDSNITDFYVQLKVHVQQFLQSVSHMMLMHKPKKSHLNFNGRERCKLETLYIKTIVT